MIVVGVEALKGLGKIREVMREEPLKKNTQHCKSSHKCP